MDRYLDFLAGVEVDDVPDVVIASGDFTSYADENEMNAAADAIRRLVSILERKPSPWRQTDRAPFVLLVPGNHDLDWSKPSHDQKIERYARMADTLYQDGKVLSSVYRAGRHETSWDFGDALNLFVCLLDSTPLGGSQDPVLLGAHKTLEELYRALPPNTRGDETFAAALKALFKEARKDPGYVEPAQLRAMAQRVAGLPPNRLKIAVMHHNPTTVPADDLESFDVIVNAGIVKRALAAAGFDLVLFGHRHVFHCCREHLPYGRPGIERELRFVSGDSIGCKENAPFVEIRLLSTPRTHAEFPPACFLSVNQVALRGGAYAPEQPSALQGILSRPLYQAWDRIAENFGRGPSLISPREDVLRAVALLLPQLQELQSRLVDWADDSSDWIRQFHFQLELYRRVYATDIYRRSSAENPRFEKYVREQYVARMRSIRSGPPGVLSFSAPVYEAILRTGWQPSPELWGDRRIQAASDNDDGVLEIARILVRPPETSRDRRTLETLDFDHRLFAIPLFVIDPKDLPARDAVDFAIGFGAGSSIIKCYEYQPDLGKVGEASLRRGPELRAIFERTLRRSELMTVSEWLGYYPGMIQDPVELRKFAEGYDHSRSASVEILSLLRKHIAPDASKTGLDIGCGTGNYTAPFADEFGRVIGLDISDEMLAVARAKSPRVNWICANALNSRLEDTSCDAVWIISTLHYFKGDRQKLLFKEVHRLLKPGGVLVADTEFAEQHRSLWVVRFFPSLADRYKGAVFAASEYERSLKEIGFTSVIFETMTASTADAGIRLGQHRPELYLDPGLRSGIPAFHEMDTEELDRGLTALRRAIEDGSIGGIVREYESAATMFGDVGLVIARR